MHISAINRQILSLSVPSIVTNITTPLLSLVDVAIVGHMGASDYIAAIAVGGSMFNMLYWLFGFLRMGSSGMTAQAFGAGDGKAQSRVLKQALLVAVIAGALMIALQRPVCDLVLRFMDVSGDTELYAKTYFYILIWGAPAVLGNYVLCGWLLGMQNSKATMWISIFINVCNIAASCMLVFVFRLGITGVATGTLTAQWLGFGLALVIAATRYNIVKITFREIVEWTGLRRFFQVNVDIFLRTVCLVTVTIWFTRTGALQGPEMLAVNALLMQFFTLFSFFMDGFGFAGEAMAGKYVGANDRPNLKASVDALCRWAFVIAVMFTLLYLAGGDLLLSLLSDDKTVVAHAHEYLHWVVTIPVVGFLAFTWDGIFIGATATRDMLRSMLGATAIFFTVYFIAYPRMHNDGLWLAFLCYLFTRGLILTIIGRRYRHIQ